MATREEILVELNRRRIQEEMASRGDAPTAGQNFPGASFIEPAAAVVGGLAINYGPTNSQPFRCNHLKGRFLPKIWQDSHSCPFDKRPFARYRPHPFEIDRTHGISSIPQGHYTLHLWRSISWTTIFRYCVLFYKTFKGSRL